MTKRSKRPLPVIIESLIELKGKNWNKSTQEVVRTDAQRILEAMVAEYGVDGAVKALQNQGFAADAYLYLLKPMDKEARKRRTNVSKKKADI